jgi:hypothetical protein
MGLPTVLINRPHHLNFDAVVQAWRKAPIPPWQQPWCLTAQKQAGAHKYLRRKRPLMRMLLTYPAVSTTSQHLIARSGFIVLSRLSSS